MPSIGAEHTLLSSQFGASNDSNYNTSSNLVLDADNKRIAIAFLVTKTMSISEVDLNLTASGTLTGINFRIRIESNSGTSPSGTILGSGNAITSSFTVSSTGFQGLKALSQPTGDIAANTLIWIILYREDGNSLSTTNKVSSRGPNAFQPPSALIFNGTSYTGGFNPANSGHILKSTTGELFGNPWTSNFNSFTTIGGTTVAGIKYKVSSKHTLRGVVANFQRNSSPGNVTIDIYQDDVLKRTVTGASPVNFTTFTTYFDPVTFDAYSTVYVIYKNPNNGGGNYVTYGAYLQEAYRTAIFDANTAYIYGTNAQPSQLSVSNSYWPRIYLLFTDQATDFICDNGCSSVFLYNNQ